MKSKVVSIVLNNFTNDSRVLKENITLQNAGYDVRVAALHHEGLKEYDEVQGIPIHRVKLTTMNLSKNMIGSLLKYVEWSYRIIREYKSSDIMHCNDLNALHIGVISKLFNKNLKIVYDAHEYETEVDGLSGLKKRLAKILEKNLIKYVDKTITVSNTIADEYVRLYNIEKPALVLNTPFYKEIEKKNIFRENLNISKEKTIFLYQGSLSSGRGIEILLDTFKQIDDEKSVIVFMGYGELEESVKKVALTYENIYFHKAVSPDILLDYTSSADFGISTIEDSCLSYKYCLPNKMFEYLMAEVLVIVSDLPEMQKIIVEHGVGIVAKENNLKGLKDAIKEALKLDKKQLKKKIHKIKEIYNWQEQEKILIDVYKELS